MSASMHGDLVIVIVDDRNVMLAAEIEKGVVAEAFVRGSIAWRSRSHPAREAAASRKPAMSSRSNLRNLASIQGRPSFGPSAEKLLGKEIADPLPRRELRTGHAKRDAFTANWKRRDGRRPRFPALGALAGVEGAVDLDRR